MHARADSQGRPLSFILTGGEASDYNAVPDLLAIPVSKSRLFLADKGYGGDFLREELLIHGIRPVIHQRPKGRTRLPVTSGHTRIETASNGCSTASNSSSHCDPIRQDPKILLSISRPGRCQDMAAILFQQALVLQLWMKANHDSLEGDVACLFRNGRVRGFPGKGSCRR
nr:transposase [Neorhizobium huautlense]